MSPLRGCLIKFQKYRIFNSITKTNLLINENKINTIITIQSNKTSYKITVKRELCF